MKIPHTRSIPAIPRLFVPVVLMVMNQRIDTKKDRLWKMVDAAREIAQTCRRRYVRYYRRHNQSVILCSHALRLLLLCCDLDNTLLDFPTRSHLDPTPAECVCVNPCTRTVAVFLISQLSHLSLHTFCPSLPSYPLYSKSYDINDEMEMEYLPLVCDHDPSTA